MTGTDWVTERVPAGFTVRLKVAEPVWGVGVELSVTVTVKVVALSGAAAMPVISPVVVEKLRPLGSAGLTA